MTTTFSRLLAGLVLATLLNACTGGESNVEKGNREGILHFGNSAEPQGLDPHTVTGLPESRILRALFEGLTVKNPYTLEPEPGVAKSWDVSGDGRVITFHINPRAKWSNGNPMTAHDYVWSWQRALHPQMGNPYAYMLFPLVNAQAFAEGEINDFSKVGVAAVDDLTLEVTLNEPTPYFLQLMDHNSTFAVHRPTIEAFGGMTDRFTGWTRVENLVGNGAFTLAEWKLNRRIRLEKSESYWDKGNVALNGIVFYPTDNLTSEERMFRVGQLHYTSDVPLDKIPGYQEMEDTPYHQAPYLGTYFYEFNTAAAPVDDARVRKALSLAVDREQLVRTVLQDSVTPAWAITPPGTMGYQPPRPFTYQPEKARQLLAQAGYPNGAGWPGVELKFNTQESNRKIAVALQQMWKDVLNVAVTVSNQEWKVYLDALKQGDFQIGRRSWIGDYVDPNNFLDLFITGGGNNHTGFADPKYDELVLRQAPRAKSREQRHAIYHEAESRLLEQMPILPIYTYTSKHLIHPSVRGAPRNLMNSLNFKYVSLVP